MNVAQRSSISWSKPITQTLKRHYLRNLPSSNGNLESGRELDPEAFANLAQSVKPEPAGVSGKVCNNGARRRCCEPAAKQSLVAEGVEALQNSEQNLKQRLNQTTVLLDQERRRNATLKGM